MRTLTTTLTILCAVGLMAYNPKTAEADDLNRYWGVAYNLLARTPEAVDETVDALEKLEGLIDHKRAVVLLEHFEECDRAWDAAVGDKDAPREAKKRPFDAYKVANAILEVIRSINDGEEAAEFEDQINDTDDYTIRPRMAMMDAIGANADHEDCFEVLMTVAKNEDGKQDIDMRILAIYYLGDRINDDEVFSLLSVLLKEKSWRIRDVAIECMTRVDGGHEYKAILALINALSNERGKLRKTIADALHDITGKDFGTDPDEWIDWFKAKKRADEGLPPKKGQGRGTRVRVFKTETYSDRFVFLVDSSTSMTERIKPEEKEKLRKSITNAPGEDKDPRRPLDWSKIHCKLDLAREELIRSLEVMDPEKTKFTLITFATEAKVWQRELMPTTDENVLAAAAFLRALKGQKLTNVFGALDAAYDLSEELGGVDVDKRKGRKSKDDDDNVVTGWHPNDSMPDTIYLYTDGYATYGKYSGDDKAWKKKSQRERSKLYGDIMKEMVREVEDRNRIARITLHTVGVGMPQDSHTLRKLANACDGEYIAIGK